MIIDAEEMVTEAIKELKHTFYEGILRALEELHGSIDFEPGKKFVRDSSVENFVTEYVEFTKEYESPESFWRWSAYAIIAATLRDHAYYPQGLKKTYPNLYVMFVAKSAESRKGAPFGTAADLLTHPQCKSTKVFRGRASIQGICDALSETIQKGGITLAGGSGIILAEELASSFVDDKALIPMLTDMHDYRERWEYQLRGTGNVGIDKLCVTMLAASNETLLTKVYTGDAVHGGLLGRTCVITPNETRKANSLMDMEIPVDALKPWIEKVRRIRDEIRGEFIITEDAKTLYRVWYERLYASYKQHADETGVLQRMHTNALKLAMVKAAATYSKTIDDAMMQEAIEELEDLRPNYKKFEIASGRSDVANIGATLLTHLSQSKEFKDTKRSFLSTYWKDISGEDLDKLAQTLDSAGMITQELAGTKTTYRLTEKAIKLFKGEKRNG